MKVANAIKKIEKATGKKVDTEGGEYRVIYGSKELSFIAESTSGDVFCINVRSINDVSDPQSDYSAGAFYRNITQAIEWGLFHGINKKTGD